MSEALHSESKVSRRLTLPTAEEVCELIYRPRLRDFANGFPYLTEINEAHVLMLHSQGLMPTAAASAISRALLEMTEAGPAEVQLDPQREDSYFNYEAHLIGKVGVDVGGRMHTARSRNDILATMDRLRTRDLLIELIDALGQVRRVALDRAKQYADVVMPGYTHLQPAQPMTYGFYLAGVAQALERDAERLSQAYRHADASPLGAGAFAGTPFAIDRQETADLLGFASVIPNTLDAVASRDFIFEVMGSLAVLAATWSRVAQDYFVWATDEFGLIDFPDSVAGTSSIMPQKKNPVVLEYLKGRAGHIAGAFAAAMATLKTTNFSHTGDANREAIAGFWDCCRDCLSALSLLRLVLESATPRSEAMLKRARENFCSATDLADALVSDTDLSFRQAHHVVGAVVRDAMDHHMAADQITLDMVDRASQDQLGHASGLTAESVAASLDPRASIAKRVAGGPAPEAVLGIVAACATRLQEQLKDNEARRASVANARAARRARTEALAA